MSALAAGELRAATIVGSPFLVGYDGWTDTFDGFPEVRGSANRILPTYGILLANNTLAEMSDGRPNDGGGRGTLPDENAGDGTYVPNVMVNMTAVTPATYDLVATLSSTDNDGLGLVFGYQDSNTYFRVGVREEDNTTGLYGFGRGVSVQKVVGGALPVQLGVSNDPMTTYFSSSNTPFTMAVKVTGTSYAIEFNGQELLTGTDPDLAPGYYGFMTWGQRNQNSTSNLFWGAQVHSMSLTSTTNPEANREHTFSGVSPVAWKTFRMFDALNGNPDGGGDGYGGFRLDFVNGTIADNSNGYAGATAAAPNVDFLSPSILVNEPGTENLTDVEMRVRVACRDDDALGVILRARTEFSDTYGEHYSFYRVVFSGSAMGTTTWRAPQGMSIQKCVQSSPLDLPVWTELFRDDQANPLFTYVGLKPPGEEVPFDLKVVIEDVVEGGAERTKISVQVISDPDGARTVINYPDVYDDTDRILSGAIGLTSWGNGDTSGSASTFYYRGDAIFSGYGGDPNAPLAVEPGTWPVSVPGDADNNGVVNAADAAILAQNWLKDVTGGPGAGDFNRDGVVDDLDASILAANWVYTGGGAAAVPEPGTLLLVGLLGLLPLALRRKR